MHLGECRRLETSEMQAILFTQKLRKSITMAAPSSPEGEFLVGFEGLESTLRIGLAVGRPWSQNH